MRIQLVYLSQVNIFSLPGNRYNRDFSVDSFLFQNTQNNGPKKKRALKVSFVGNDWSILHVRAFEQQVGRTMEFNKHPLY